MKLRLLSFFPVIALVLGFSAAALQAATAKSYPVNLSTPWKVGEKFGERRTASADMQMVMNVEAAGQPPRPMQQQQQKQSVHLDADAEVLAVFPNGGLQKVALTLRKFTGAADAKPEADLLPAGTKVVVEKNGKDKSYTVDGKPAAAELVQFLKLAVDLDDPAHTDQEVLGPKAAVAVGDAWPVNGTLMAESLKEDFGDSVTCTGSLKLDGIKGSGASQVAAVSGTFKFDHLQLPIPSFVVKTAEGQAELSGNLPASHSGVETRSLKLAIKLAGEAPGPNGAKLSLDMTGTQENWTEITYR